MTLSHPNHFILAPLFSLGLALFLAACGQQAESPAPAGSEMQPAEGRSRCPTCAMYADMTPEWQAAIEYQDGSVLYFDVPEHMLAFYIDPTRHDVSEYQKNRDNISQITVTGYESKSAIDARQAFYVAGSNVKSPMGEGVVPFQSKESAEQFQQQHGGRILTFSEFNPGLVTEIQ